MPTTLITLKILLPYKVFSQQQQVKSIVAMTHDGAMGILPHRLDCVAALSAGILAFVVEGKEEAYVAVDEGILVKTGLEVLVSVRNAMAGMGLDKLREALEQEFIQLDAQEQKVRAVLAKMEGGLIRRLAGFEQDKSLS
ncbi:F0F1 ATP synthase subunit epsilon [Rheinheimera maricola]|uniref:ATP synthase epsilon chain n=1 Tax=Rheinheimera maricola TaxID=2793282 RepID=A0ABS7XA77_9GAMM|nr:F0F1 ATP synthase subunit epsilon [Rheinheimera maricola]MBZ9612454.1 F0F1 ATP synthase subunit epsilon [Rheinheimera maricola]